jgi:hypothetical protein
MSNTKKKGKMENSGKTENLGKKVKKEKEIVKCLDCSTEYDLFYDLSTVVEIDELDGEEVEGIDIDNERDPIRCILCRKYTRVADNETLQCEECLESNKVFVWTGKYNDTIVCTDCQ